MMIQAVKRQLDTRGLVVWWVVCWESREQIFPFGGYLVYVWGRKRRRVSARCYRHHHRQGYRAHTPGNSERVRNNHVNL